MKEILLGRKSGCQQIGARKIQRFSQPFQVAEQSDLGVSGTIRGIGKEPAVRGDRGVELDKFLRNDGGRKFKDVTASAGVGDAGFGASATWLDYGRGLLREHHGLLRRMGSRRP